MYKATILVIDDEQQFLDIITNTLKTSDYKVIQALNGEMGVMVALKFIPDIIICDWEMPVMNGIEAIRILKQHDLTKDIPVIMATGKMTSSENLNTALKAGAVDYIRKPIESIELIARINSTIKLSNSIAEIKKQNTELFTQAEVLTETNNELEAHKYNLEGIVKTRTTELEKAKDRAEESDRLKSAFLTNMSHEIRTPMNAIVGFSNLLAGTITESVPKEYLNNIQTSSKSLLALISDILDLSEIEAVNLEMNEEWEELKTFFDEIITIFEKDINELSLEFNVNILADLKTSILIDKIRVRQIVVNLLSNAVKFTHQGFVNLRVDFIENESYENKYVDLRLVIEDSGIGIAKEFQQKIFQAFYQQNSESIRKYGGTGMGLALCQRLIQLMNGSIEVKSEVNTGTTFTVILPRIQIANQAEIKKYKHTIDAEEKKLPEQMLTETEKTELLGLLKGSLMHKWLEFESQQPMDEVRLFANELQGLAKKYPHIELILMAEELIEAVDSFDISELLEILKQYPQFILKLED